MGHEAEQNLETLLQFQAAWRDKDVSTLMNLVTDDIVFVGSVGSEPGRTWKGKQAVKEGFEHFLGLDSGRLVLGEPVVTKDSAFAEWSWMDDRPTGTILRERGIDRFAFKNGKIFLKDGFRKVCKHAAQCLMLPPGRADGRFEPYQKRKIRFLGSQLSAGAQVKTYWIDAGNEHDTLPSEIADSVEHLLPSLVRDSERLGGHHAMAFCIVHTGQSGTWLLFEWWAYQEILYSFILRAESDTAEFVPLGNQPIRACVWENIVIEFERKAWAKHMLTEQPNPGAYISASLPYGKY
jgi:ketosteroid isomerase-like protein